MVKKGQDVYHSAREDGSYALDLEDAIEVEEISGDKQRPVILDEEEPTRKSKLNNGRTPTPTMLDLDNQDNFKAVIADPKEFAKKSNKILPKDRKLSE